MLLVILSVSRRRCVLDLHVPLGSREKSASFPRSPRSLTRTRARAEAQRKELIIPHTSQETCASSCSHFDRWISLLKYACGKKHFHVLKILFWGFVKIRFNEGKVPFFNVK